MSDAEPTLLGRLEEAERALQEANETLDAIRNGEVDAVVVGGPAGQFVYTLENADRPYRVLVEQMKEGAVTVSGDGLILYGNQSFRTLIKRPMEELVGTSLFNYVGDAALVRRMLDHQSAPSAELALHSSSGPIPINLSVVELQVEDGAPRMLCGIFTDLSQNYARTAELTQAHKRLEERTGQLEASEARLRTMFDTSYQFQGLLDPDGIVLDANSVALDAIGASLDAVVGQAYWDSAWFSQTPDLPATIKAMVRSLIVGGPRLRTELTMNLLSGKRCLDFSLRPIRDETGRLTAMVSEAVDLTDMRTAEEALRQAQKLEAIGQLTGGVAHDFNNLLTVIRGSVDLLQRPHLSEEKRRRYIDAIGQTADRATKLTGQLLAFARRQALKPELFEIGESLENVRGIVSSLIGSRISLHVEMPDIPCFVMADRGQFDTAIVNLAINARDAMDGEGQITLTTSFAKEYPAVRNHPAVTGDYLAISVCDTGTGISPENRDRIFEPFFTTKEVGAGTGLGLSQVIGFAKQSDGEIAVESEQGQGTTFTLYLPRAEGCLVDTDEIEMVGDDLTGKGVCVLLVEDNPEVGTFATQALMELGYDSVLASNADEALALLEADFDRFHIVFSDVIMPGTSGIELGREVQRRYPHIPVMLASGYSHVLAADGDQGFELIHKPYSIDELSRVIRKVLKAAKVNRAIKNGAALIK